MLNGRQIALCTVVVLCVFRTCIAEDTGFWSLEIPVPDYATNVASTVDRQFLIKSVTFDWEAADTKEIREFYGSYFKSIGWEDPTADSTGFSDLRAAGWASYSMSFTESNRPIAKYGTMWKASSYPAQGVVALQLDAFEDGKFRGSADVRIGPEVDMSALFLLTGLIGNNPANLFKLHAAVNGNPFEIHTIALPANYQEESDPLLAEYYQMIDEIKLEFREWERQYILD